MRVPQQCPRDFVGICGTTRTACAVQSPFCARPRCGPRGMVLEGYLVMSKSQNPRACRTVDRRDPRLVRLIASALSGAEILNVTALKSDTTNAVLTAKDTGYGAPLRIDVQHDGVLKSVVLHSATPNPFGHEHRANRAEEMLIAADTFDLVPRHTRVFDVGAFRGNEDFVSLRDTGEFYLLTEYAEGHPYAHDLRQIAEFEWTRWFVISSAPTPSSCLMRVCTPARSATWLAVAKGSSASSTVIQNTRRAPRASNWS